MEKPGTILGVHVDKENLMRLLGKFTMASSVAITLLSPVQASAGLVFDASLVLSAQGFGTAPRDLTVQRMGNTTSPESGCVSASGGSFSVGAASCMGADAAFMGNGFVNVGGNEPNPLSDNQKFGAPFESDRGITTAADIGILFNATEPNGDQVNILDLTLKFFLNGVLIGSIDGQQNFANSNPGNGVAGFVFRVDAAQTPYVNGLLALGNIQFALESTLSETSGGPESFRIVNLNAPTAIPEPASMALFGLAALVMAGRVRRSH